MIKRTIYILCQRILLFFVISLLHVAVMEYTCFVRFCWQRCYSCIAKHSHHIFLAQYHHRLLSSIVIFSSFLRVSSEEQMKWYRKFLFCFAGQVFSFFFFSELCTIFSALKNASNKRYALKFLKLTSKFSPVIRLFGYLI